MCVCRREKFIGTLLSDTQPDQRTPSQAHQESIYVCVCVDVCEREREGEGKKRILRAISF